MAASADLKRRVLMISGAIDTKEHDIAVSFKLSRLRALAGHQIGNEPDGSVVPNLADDRRRRQKFANDTDAMLVSRQFAKTFMTPDQSRITFYDGEVRPGEAVLKMFTIECAKRRGNASHARFQPPTTESPKKVKGLGASPLIVDTLIIGS